MHFVVRGTEQASSVKINELETLPSINYGGVEWGVQSVRLSPPNIFNVVTIIVDVRVHNYLSSEVRVPKSYVSLLNNKGQIIALDRFANNESNKFLFLSPGQVKEITLPFKVINQNLDFENWVIRVQENYRKTPAFLPVAGEPMVITNKIEFVEPASFEQNNYKLTANKVGSQLNHGVARAVEGREFLFLEMMVEDPLEKLDLDTVNWSLEADGQNLTGINQLYEKSDLTTLIKIVFDIPEAAESLNLSANFLDGSKASFAISSAPIS